MEEEEDGGRVQGRRDEGRMEEGGEVWFSGFLQFRRRRRDLTLIGGMRLWLLRRPATLPIGPVAALLKVCSDLDTKHIKLKEGPNDFPNGCKVIKLASFNMSINQLIY